MNQETKNKMAQLIAEARAKQTKVNTMQAAPIVKDEVKEFDNLNDIRQAANSGKTISLLNLSNLINKNKSAVKVAEVKDQEQPKEETPAHPKKEHQQLTLKSFVINWHEGRHEKAKFEGKIFVNWYDLQQAFFDLWHENERGQDGGYTKVNFTISFNETEETSTQRIDITNRSKNGDFNPTEETVFNYVKEMIDDEEYCLNFTDTIPTPQKGVNEFLADIIEEEKENSQLAEILADQQEDYTATAPSIESLINSIEETERAKDDSCFNEELSTLTIEDLLGQATAAEQPKETVFCNPSTFALPIAKTSQPTSQDKAKIEIIDYNENSFALIGEGTKAIKDKLKVFGRFNPHLKCGAGWIFSKKHLATVTKLIN